MLSGANSFASEWISAAEGFPFPSSTAYGTSGELGVAKLIPKALTPSIISEVLREKRGLTVEHTRKLSRRFHLSSEVFF
jgi:hypothetical protein